jgi:hypothetical protein
LNQFAFKNEPSFRRAGSDQVEGPRPFELLKLPGTAHDLPNAIVQKLWLAVGPRDEDRLDRPLNVGLVPIRLGEFKIAAGFAADGRTMS